MPISIRAAAPSDRAFIETLGKRTVMTSVSALRHPEPPAVIANYEQLLKIVDARAHVALIADVDGVPAGFILMLDSMPDEVTGEDQAFVAYMAVERDARGKGVGAALLAAAEDEARVRGLPYMALMVTEENVAARTLYEGAGYVTERRLMCKTL